MRAIVNWCLNRRSVVILGTCIILLAGIFGATQLRQQLFPDVDFPFVMITANTTGLSADAVDTKVAQPLASVARAGENVSKVFTISSPGAARVYVQLDYGSDTQKESRDLVDKMNALDLPAGTSPLKAEGGFNSQASLVTAIAAPDGNLATLQPRALKLKADLEKIDGVSRVELAGLSTPEYRIVVTKNGLAKGITPPMVAAAVNGAQGVAPAGAISADGRELPVVVKAAGIGDKSQLARVKVNGVPLGSVATIAKADNPLTGFARTDGKPAISVSVFRSTKSNEVRVVDAASKKIDALKKEIGAKNVTTVVETATPVRKSIKGLLTEGLLGALFAVIVIFLFLRSGRGTLIAAVSIPTSIVFGLLVAWGLGLTLDIITLAGLTIAIGRVIDDGIVVIENIYKHLERGEERRSAVLEGTTEVTVAIAASTITTVAVFLPIGLVGGLISEIFLSFSIIVSVALLASFVVATTVIPVLASMLLKPSDTPHDPEDTRLARAVEPATRFGLRHRFITISLAFVAFVVTLVIVGTGAIPIQFLPGSGTQQLSGTVQLPPGTTAVEAQKLMAPVEEWARTLPGTKDYQLAYGSALVDEQGRGTPSTASFFINLKDSADADKSVTVIRKKGESKFPGAFSVMRISNGPPTGSFQATITAPDQQSLVAASDKITALLKKRTDTVEIASNAVQSQPQLQVKLKPGAPVSATDVQATIQALSATLPAGSAADGSQITVSTDPALVRDVAALSKLPIVAGGGFGGSAAGGALPAAAAAVTSASAGAPTGSTLGEVATAAVVAEPAFIQRTDGKLSATVSATILGKDSRGTISAIQKDTKKLELGTAKVNFDLGDNQFITQMLRDLGLAMIVAVLLVYVVLVISFGSIAQPITILAPVLFSLIGSLMALVITQNALGLPAMIGQLLLIGIVVSNSILVVDTAIRLRKAGVPRDMALIRAAKLRVRPVLMTASATIASLVPLAAGISGEGGIISKSLGAVVIGGLTVATALTLVIVPAVYTIFDRKKDDEKLHAAPASPTGGSHSDDPRASTPVAAGAGSDAGGSVEE